MSIERLTKKGFHPQVTSLTSQELLDSWLVIHDRMMKKPKAPQGGNVYIGPIGIQTKRLTLVSDTV